MKKTFLTLCVGLIVSACSTSTSTKNEITWETLGNRLNSEGNTEFVQRFVVKPDGPIEGFAFGQFKRDMVPVNSEDTVIEILPGYYLVKSPRFQNVESGDSVVVDIVTSGNMNYHLWLPDGVHMVRDGQPLAVDFTRKRLTSFPEQWIDPKTGKDYMVYGEDAFVINDSLRTTKKVSPYGQIPTLKQVKLTNGKVNAKDLLAKDFKVSQVKDSRIDYWTATITDNGVELTTNSDNPQVIEDRLRRRIIASTDSEGFVPTVEIEDWSDYPYRGIMLDVARNFLPKENVKEYIDYLSNYGLNTLHFHLGEDEGWRLEIPSLPELTEVGSRRGYTLTDDVPFLKGIYSGDGNPNSPTVANGFYTVADFIDILQYANSKGVAVIPEFDTPGHSRAAIRAMEWRAKTTGDSTFRLIHDGDTSKYRTAQDFYDNIMNPALEGPYKFWGVVMDDVIDIYKKAGVPLHAINIGGDEVANNAWSGSDKARALMEEKGFKTQKDLHGYFVERVAEQAKEKGVKIMGWEDIALVDNPQYDAIVAPVTYGVNSWNYSGSDVTKTMAKNGFPVILSNVDLLYFDHHYSGHPEDPGMWWGGFVTEFKPLEATIDNLLPDTSLQDKVIGVSAQIFSETVRDFPMVQRFTFPRILGLAERAHNSHATINNEEYFANITEEMPVWQEEGIDFFVRQPGIIVEDGMVKMNEPYGFGEIRYTTDNSEPTKESQVYTGPFKAEKLDGIRAKLFVGNSSSATSFLKNKN